MKEIKDITYYFLRLPGALIGLALVCMTFVPNWEPELGEISDLLRVTFLTLGIYILCPNHRFSSPRLYKIRLYSCSLIGLALLYFGISMILDYLGGEKDSVMIPISIFILYNAFALPASVWLRRRNPQA